MFQDARKLLDSFAEVRFAQRTDFLKIMETLTRVGVSDEDAGTLTQVCHILHKAGRYYIVHFKEMKKLDGEQVDFTEFDHGIRNQIAFLLHEWKLLELVMPDSVREPRTPMSHITVLQFSEKKDWKLTSQYKMGEKRQPARSYN